VRTRPIYLSAREQNPAFRAPGEPAQRRRLGRPLFGLHKNECPFFSRLRLAAAAISPGVLPKIDSLTFGYLTKIAAGPSKQLEAPGVKTRT
jgi:hypothetical protein